MPTRRRAAGLGCERADIVIDPTTRRVTDLVVEPHDRHDLARLVPVARMHTEATSDTTIALDCTVAEISALEPVQKSAYLRLSQNPGCVGGSPEMRTGPEGWVLSGATGKSAS